MVDTAGMKGLITWSGNTLDHCIHVVERGDVGDLVSAPARFLGGITVLESITRQWREGGWGKVMGIFCAPWFCTGYVAGEAYEGWGRGWWDLIVEVGGRHQLGK